MSLRALAAGIPAVVRRDYVASTAAHWLTLASGLLLFHLVARRASVNGFAYYQVARGVVATVQPFALLGLVPALHRYLPRAGDRARILALQAFLVQVVVMDVLGLIGLVLADDVGRLLGIPGGVNAARAVVVLAAGNCLVVVTMAGLRGNGQVRLSNAVSLSGLGLLPLFAFACTTRIDLFLAIQGAAMAFLAFGGIVAVRRHAPSPQRPPATPARHPPAPPAEHPPAQHPPAQHPPAPPALRTLLRFGIRRAPGEIALPALFAFPTFFVAGAAPGSPAPGFIGFATSAITLICSVFGMLTPVLLPRLSGYFQSAPLHLPGRSGGRSLTRGLKTLPLAAAALAALGVLFFAVVAPPLVHNFLGSEFHDAIDVLRAALPAAIPLAAFYAARPTLDALQETPVISRVLLLCLGVEIALTYATAAVASPAAAAILGLTVAAVLLGALSYAALLRAIPARQPRR
ncbi:hypothetical protein ACQP2F_23450 [Actinoplanes sp. CA-030573]|uniref:hypothetical protein n=1 Tax=Actinoplanes sp. CA-030573 TaxID=3239898 RepID=UPI003D9071AE